jgi:hypothetical protein
MFKWIHHLLNPHCEHCTTEKENAKQCASCDTLRSQLASKTHECEVLLDRLLNPKVPETSNTGPVEVTRPNPTRNTTWGVRRQMLEEQDRKAAQLMKQAPQAKPFEVAPQSNSSVEQLEKELGVDDAVQEVREEKIQG